MIGEMKFVVLVFCCNINGDFIGSLLLLGSVVVDCLISLIFLVWFQIYETSTFGDYKPEKLIVLLLMPLLGENSGFLVSA